MKFIAFLIVGMFSILTLYSQDKPADWANYARYAEANKTAPRGANAVFMGNSITEGWVKADPDFFSANNYIGRGISGQVSSQMLARFRADVIDLAPKTVVILSGTNDLAQNHGYIAEENIYSNIISMAELAKINNITPIICSILPAFEYRWNKGLEPAGKIVKINGMLRDYAQKNGIIYVDYHTEMKDYKDGLPESISEDGVHVNLDGYRIMESIVKQAIDKAMRQ